MADPAVARKETLARTPLYDLHVAQGARMVPFAGYAMPVQYKAGIIAEHLHTRAKAGLFDVSHMGQAVLSGRDAARKLETLVPADIAGLAAGRQRYTQFLDDNGGILDDLMVTRLPGSGERLGLIVNASNKDADFEHVREKLPDLQLEVLADRALLALQGPQAASRPREGSPGRRDHGVHVLARDGVGRHHSVHLALRLYRRRRVRDFRPCRARPRLRRAAARRRAGHAHRARGARLAASRSRALPARP